MGIIERELDSYYYSFEPTECGHVDAILEVVAIAGRRQHSTELWADDGRLLKSDTPRESCEGAIQRVAELVAGSFAKLELDLTAANARVAELENVAMRDDTHDGHHYRRMRRVMLYILHAMGDPEIRVFDFNGFVEQEEFYDTMLSYIDPLLAVKENADLLEQSAADLTTALAERDEARRLLEVIEGLMEKKWLLDFNSRPIPAGEQLRSGIRAASKSGP